jgi:hypothetical protein
MVDKRTDTQKKNDDRFANRRKMAFWSLYAVLLVTLSVTVKILIAPALDVGQYSIILNWSLSILGGVVLAFIGAASVEQIKTPLIGNDSTVVLGQDERLVKAADAPVDNGSPDPQSNWTPTEDDTDPEVSVAKRRNYQEPEELQGN